MERGRGGQAPEEPGLSPIREVRTMSPSWNPSRSGDVDWLHRGYTTPRTPPAFASNYAQGPSPSEVYLQQLTEDLLSEKRSRKLEREELERTVRRLEDRLLSMEDCSYKTNTEAERIIHLRQKLEELQAQYEHRKREVGRLQKEVELTTAAREQEKHDALVMQKEANIRIEQLSCEVVELQAELGRRLKESATKCFIQQQEQGDILMSAFGMQVEDIASDVVAAETEELLSGGDDGPWQECSTGCVRVVAVTKGPAKDAGLAPGDTIISVGEMDIAATVHLQVVLAAFCHPDVRVVYRRGRERCECTLSLHAPPTRACEELSLDQPDTEVEIAVSDCIKLCRLTGGMAGLLVDYKRHITQLSHQLAAERHCRLVAECTLEKERQQVMDMQRAMCSPRLPPTPDRTADLQLAGLNARLAQEKKVLSVRLRRLVEDKQRLENEVALLKTSLEEALASKPANEDFVGEKAGDMVEQEGSSSYLKKDEWSRPAHLEPFAGEKMTDWKATCETTLRMESWRRPASYTEFRGEKLGSWADQAEVEKDTWRKSGRYSEFAGEKPEQWRGDEEAAREAWRRSGRYTEFDGEKTGQWREQLRGEEEAWRRSGKYSEFQGEKPGEWKEGEAAHDSWRKSGRYSEFQGEKPGEWMGQRPPAEHDAWRKSARISDIPSCPWNLPSPTISAAASKRTVGVSPIIRSSSPPPNELTVADILDAIAGPIYDALGMLPSISMLEPIASRIGMYARKVRDLSHKVQQIQAKDAEEKGKWVEWQQHQRQQQAVEREERERAQWRCVELEKEVEGLRKALAEQEAQPGAALQHAQQMLQEEQERHEREAKEWGMEKTTLQASLQQMKRQNEALEASAKTLLKKLEVAKSTSNQPHTPRKSDRAEILESELEKARAKCEAQEKTISDLETAISRIAGQKKHEARASPRIPTPLSPLPLNLPLTRPCLPTTPTAQSTVWTVRNLSPHRGTCQHPAPIAFGPSPDRTAHAPDTTVFKPAIPTVTPPLVQHPPPFEEVEVIAHHTKPVPITTYDDFPYRNSDTTVQSPSSSSLSLAV